MLYPFYCIFFNKTPTFPVPKHPKSCYNKILGNIPVSYTHLGEMAATMKDIARRTGLGLATISSYFNGGNVREKNRIKIEEAIEELHYEVNEVARGLKTNATRTIGVVIPELNNTFCAEIITGMEDRCV